MHAFGGLSHALIGKHIFLAEHGKVFQPVARTAQAPQRRPGRLFERLRFQQPLHSLLHACMRIAAVNPLQTQGLVMRISQRVLCLSPGTC